MSKVRLGIIGGGQLGMYLSEAAQALGVEACVWAQEVSSPALVHADRRFVGPLDDPATFNGFVRSCDVITFEKENIPDNVVHALALAEREGLVTINPGTDVLLMLKDKGLQKAWMNRVGLPTLPHKELCGGKPRVRRLVREIGFPLIQKSCKGGYDGRGVQLIRDDCELDKLWEIPSIIEPFLAERREIAVIAARSGDGEIVTYPPMAMEFDEESNALHMVATPTAMSDAQTQRALELARDCVQLLEGVGIFAIEMFLTSDGELLLNEISPRVHNSGHLTLEACNISQFEQHVRAVIGLPLLQVTTRAPAAMINLLYASELEHSCPPRPLHYQRGDSPVAIHWYGKPPGRYKRKMGHITVVSSSVNSAVQEANAALQGLLKPAVEATR